MEVLGLELLGLELLGMELLGVEGLMTTPCLATVGRGRVRRAVPRTPPRCAGGEQAWTAAGC
ncbi:hypothetical protein [Pseudokineococcus sp. 1T1Z-3]|uniref:hypothetical protein n=1 Tax=Pseudokineococcus sp. 1T1Z-3 TaxID=3132745 RepID=UPI00309D622A